MSENFNISSMYSKENEIVITFDKKLVKDISIQLENKKEAAAISTESIKIDENTMHIDTRSFTDMLKPERDAKWKISFYANGKKLSYTNEEVVRKSKQTNLPTDFRFKQSNPVAIKAIAGQNYIIYPYFNSQGVMFICVISEELYAIKSCIGKILDVKFNKKRFAIKFEFPKCEFSYKCLNLYYRTAVSDEKQEIKMVTDSIKDEGDKYIINAHIDFDKCNFKARHWDLAVRVTRDGKEYNTDVKSKSKNLKNKLSSVFYRDVINMGNDMILFMHTTYKNSISLMYRKRGAYDTRLFKLKERIALLEYMLLKPYYNKKKIYLVFEKYCQMAQDNGYYFFKYCMDNNMEKEFGAKIYYVIDKDAKDCSKLNEYKQNVLDFMSIKHIRHLLAANLLISTDSKRHGYAWDKCSSILSDRIYKKRSVFLQHGVIAFKVVESFGKNKIDTCDMFITSSDAEKKIICEHLGYNENEVAVTGLARWDVLEDASQNSNEIMLVPTWRNYLEGVEDERFINSLYYKEYMKLISSERLAQILEKYNLRLNFYIHVKLKEYLKNFHSENDRIRIISFGEEPLNKMMMQSKLLITDYSSVAWDMFHQNKPVLFYQFDLDDYNEAHGSYIDMSKELFGDRAVNYDELLELIEEYAKNGLKQKEKYALMRNDSYKYIDKDNSKRICEEIKKRGW